MYKGKKSPLNRKNKRSREERLIDSIITGNSCGVNVVGGNLSAAIREFRKVYKASGKAEKIKEGKYYVSKAEVRRKQRDHARYVNSKNNKGG